MLGDCYCSVVVEHLSKNELMACDAIAIYQDASPGHVSNDATNPRDSVPELVVVSLDGNSKMEQ